MFGLKCLQELDRFARTIGASLWDESEEAGFLVVDAPIGYVWEATDATTITISATNVSQSFWRDACKSAREDIALGARLATEEEIVEIEHSRDEPWRAPGGSPEILKP